MAKARKVRPMIRVSDIGATIEWYRAAGFELVQTHEDDGRIERGFTTPSTACASSSSETPMAIGSSSGQSLEAVVETV
jgi:hypothetical protein